MDDEQPVTGAERITVSRSALRLELLEMEVRIKEFFNPRFTNIETDIRNLQEDARLAKERVLTEKTVLATETERRRVELSASLEVEEHKWSLRGHKAEIVLGMGCIASISIAITNAIHLYL